MNDLVNPFMHKMIGWVTVALVAATNVVRSHVSARDGEVLGELADNHVHHAGLQLEEQAGAQWTLIFPGVQIPAESVWRKSINRYVVRIYSAEPLTFFFLEASVH